VANLKDPIIMLIIEVYSYNPLDAADAIDEDDQGGEEEDSSDDQEPEEERTGQEQEAEATSDGEIDECTEIFQSLKRLPELEDPSVGINLA